MYMWCIVRAAYPVVRQVKVNQQNTLQTMIAQNIMNKILIKYIKTRGNVLPDIHVIYQ